MKAAARVLYKKDWETDRPIIMEKYGWTRCNSEVLISTPRRFGKTYSIVRTHHQTRKCKTNTFPRMQAIFCACLAMTFGLEIVVFSPARRASRKLLERVCTKRLCDQSPALSDEVPFRRLSSLSAWPAATTPFANSIRKLADSTPLTAGKVWCAASLQKLG